MFCTQVIVGADPLLTSEISSISHSKLCHYHHRSMFYQSVVTIAHCLNNGQTTDPKLGDLCTNNLYAGHLNTEEWEGAFDKKLIMNMM